MKNNKNNALNNILGKKKKICLIIIVSSTISGAFLTQIKDKLFIEKLSEELDERKEEASENQEKEIEEQAREAELEWLKEKLANEYENKSRQLDIFSWDDLTKEEREQLIDTDKKWSEE